MNMVGADRFESGLNLRIRIGRLLPFLPPTASSSLEGRADAEARSMVRTSLLLRYHFGQFRPLSRRPSQARPRPIRLPAGRVYATALDD